MKRMLIGRLKAAEGQGGLTGQACVDLDRTEFGSIHGTSRFFRFLGRHVVKDILNLHLKIHTTRPQSQAPAARGVSTVCAVAPRRRSTAVRT